jgi:hypothetical protein
MKCAYLDRRSMIVRITDLPLTFVNPLMESMALLACMIWFMFMC